MSRLPLCLAVLLCALPHLTSASPLPEPWQPVQVGRIQPAVERRQLMIAERRNSTETEIATFGTTALLGEGTPSEVRVGQFLTGELSYPQYHFFSYKPAALNVPFDFVMGSDGCSTTWSDRCEVDLLMNGSPYPTWANATYSWWQGTVRIDNSHPLSCEYRNVPLANCTYHYSLTVYQNNVTYYTTVMLPPAGIAELKGGVALTGTLAGSQSAYYYVTNGELAEILVFALSVTAGDCDLYVSTRTEQPGPSDYMWSSRDDGDDLVIVNSTSTSTSGRPALYFYVGVYNKRSTSSSYSIVGSSYTTRGNPINNAWYLTADKSQSDFAMANTFRYYYLYVQGVWPVMTITLDSLRGDADIYANVAQYSSSADVWPTRSSHQYNSTVTSGRDQVNITNPTAGYYVFIAVYSKGADSRYSILVSGEGRLTTLYSYGSVIEAEVSRGQSLYYVLTVPTQYLYNYRLAFTLRSMSGNGDLYISDRFTHPNATHSNWTSQAAGDGLDMTVLRGDVTNQQGVAQLHAGNYYVAVRAVTDTSFQLWAYLRERQFVQLNSLIEAYHSGGVLYWEIEVPRGTEFTVMAQPQSYYGGSFNLYVGNVAEPIPSVSTTYQVMNNGAARVTPAVSSCAGTGTLCRYYIAVERVNAANETTYASFSLFVYSANVPAPYLVPDVPMEKTLVAAGGSTYQFNVTCPRAKVSVMLVTTASQWGSTAPISVNRGPLPPFSAFNNVEFGFDETVASGMRTFTLSFDYNHPVLRGQSMIGNYHLSVYPASTSGWTLLLRIDNGNCAALQPTTAMRLTMPYAVTVANASQLTYYSYRTAANATGYMYFTVTPQNSSTPASSLSILARVDGDLPAAGYSQFTSDSTGVLRVNADACSNGGMCEYMIAVRSTVGRATFYLTASLGQPLYAMDGSASTAKLAGSVARMSTASGTAVVARGVTPVSLVAESCVGSVSVYLNYRTAAIPTSTAADVSAATVTTPTALPVVTNAVNQTHLVASVVGLGDTGSNSFEARVLVNVTWAAAAPTATSTAVTAVPYSQVTAGNARIRVPIAAIPSGVTAGTIRQPTGATGFLRYSVYVVDRTDTTPYNMRSRCGLDKAMLVHTAYGLTTSTNTVEFKLPLSTHRYSVAVLVDHVWRTTVAGRQTYTPSSPGYLAFTPVTEVRSGTLIPDDDDSSSSGMNDLPPAAESATLSAPIIAVIVIGAVAIIAGGLFMTYRYHTKQQRVDGGRVQNDWSKGGHEMSLPLSNSAVQSHEVTGEAFYAMQQPGAH